MEQKSTFTSQILIISAPFEYNKVSFDIKRSINAKKAIILDITDEKSIKIDQVRGLHAEIASPPTDPEMVRIVLIHPLEKLLYVAQEALLKLLEEPPERTLFVLVGQSTSNLSPTILSRCQIVTHQAESGQESPAAPEEALTSTSVSQNELERFWETIRTSTTPEEILGAFSSAPDKKEEALNWLRLVLTQPLLPEKSLLAVRQGLLDGHQALLSNVSPKLVWAHVVQTWYTSQEKLSG